MVPSLIFVHSVILEEFRQTYRQNCATIENHTGYSDHKKDVTLCAIDAHASHRKSLNLQSKSNLYL